jgi:signal transduction histidine kinase
LIVARRSLATRLSLLSAVITVTVTGVALSALLVLGGRTVVRQEMQELAQSAELYAAAVRQSLRDAAGTIETLAALSGGCSPVFTAETRRLSQAVLGHGSLFSHLLLLDPDGKVLLVEPEKPGAESFRSDLSYAAWYAELSERRQTVVSDLFISTIDRRPTIVVAAPVLDPHGAIAAIWAGSLDLERLSALHLMPTGTDSRRAGYLTDRRGLVIAYQGNHRYVEEQTDFHSVPGVREALAGKKGTARYFNPFEQQEKLAAYLPLELTPGSPPWAVAYAVPTGYTLDPLDSLAWAVLGLGMLLAVLIAGLTVFGLRRFLKPLDSLVAAAERIGSGDFSSPPPPRTGDELEELGQAIARMAEGLRRKDERIHAQLTELQASNRELEAFSYSVSHDLRAPLRSIDGFSQALLEDYADSLPAEGAEYLGYLREASQQMGVLIDDLIRLSRLTRDELHSEEVDLSALARQAAEELRSREPDRAVELRIQPQVQAVGDPRLLRHVFQNLLGNAWKFTSRNPQARIEFGVQDGAGESRYFVRDNGVGFDMAYAKRLFSPFQRLHAKSEFEGSGIGLSLVQRVVRRHGGRVWAEAQPDRGATFYFTLKETDEE